MRSVEERRSTRQASTEEQSGGAGDIPGWSGSGSEGDDGTAMKVEPSDGGPAIVTVGSTGDDSDQPHISPLDDLEPGWPVGLY